MSFADECNINHMFCKKFGQETMVIEHSIFIPKLNFLRYVECGTSGVSHGWKVPPAEYALMV
jgi:hypothetical protein